MGGKKVAYLDLVDVFEQGGEHEVHVVEGEFGARQVHAGLDDALGRRLSVLDQLDLKQRQRY